MFSVKVMWLLGLFFDFLLRFFCRIALGASLAPRFALLGFLRRFGRGDFGEFKEIVHSPLI